MPQLDSSLYGILLSGVVALTVGAAVLSTELLPLGFLGLRSRRLLAPNTGATASAAKGPLSLFGERGRFSGAADYLGAYAVDARRFVNPASAASSLATLVRMAFTIAGTSDHKLIGRLYVIFGFLSALVGSIFSVIIRLQLTYPGSVLVAENYQFYNIMVTMHAFVMIVRRFTQSAVALRGRLGEITRLIGVDGSTPGVGLASSPTPSLGKGWATPPLRSSLARSPGTTLASANGGRLPPLDVKHSAYRMLANSYGTRACRERRPLHRTPSYRDLCCPRPTLWAGSGTPRYWARQTNPFYNHPWALTKASRRYRVGWYCCGSLGGPTPQIMAYGGKASELASPMDVGGGGPKAAGRATLCGNAGSADSPKGESPPRRGGPLERRGSRRSPHSSIPFFGGYPNSQRSSVPARTLATSKRDTKGGREYQWPISGAKVLESLATLQPISAYGADNPLPDLRPLVCHPEALYAAYGRIRSSPGNMTPATGTETLDGPTAGFLQDLSRRLSTGAFTFSPARRKYIPKASGGQRPLTIAAPRDKIPQEALRAVLEPLFDPTFSKHSHGFRPGRGCHSALNEIHRTWSGVTWFLEVDIERCFDSIDHSRLMALLSKRGLKSETVTQLLWKGLRSRVVDLGSCHRLREGIPQGSVLSPLLANIYLDQVDRWLEERVQAYSRGSKRARNLEYARRQYAIRLAPNRRVRRKLRGELQRSGLTPLIMADPNFRRMKWVRYADDILIGVTGPRSDVEALREDLGAFLGTLGLRLSPQKTLITCGYPARARFLGHRIGTPNYQRRPVRRIRRRGGAIVASRVTPRQALYGDVRDLVLRLEKRGYCRKGVRGVPTRVGRLVYLPEAMIVQHFRTLFLSLAGYYSGATNFSTIRNRLGYILRYSCARTLGAKLRLRTRRKVFNRFGPSLAIRGADGKTVLASFPPGLPNSLRKGFSRMGPAITAEMTIERLTRRVARVRELFEGACTLCGSSSELQVHHVRRLSPRPAGRPKKGAPKPEPASYVTEMMRRMNRKQITLCAPCHRQVHRGAHDGPALAKLAKST